MTKFESLPQPDIPKRSFSVILEVCVQAEGYWEAAQAARKTLMSADCPTKLIVTDLSTGEMLDQVWVDLND